MAQPPPYQAAPLPPHPTTAVISGAAIASLVLGILSFAACFFIVTGIPAVVCGHIALRKIKRNPDIGGKTLATSGLILGYLANFICVAAVVIHYGIIWWEISSIPELTEEDRVKRFNKVPVEKAKFYIVTPKGYKTSNPVPLAIWLHHHGQNPKELKESRDQYQHWANELGIAFIEVSATARRTKGYEWTENLEADRQYIFDLLSLHQDKIKPEWPRVALIGFGQGAKVAGDVALSDPEKFAGAILMSPVGNKYKPAPLDPNVKSHKSQTYFCFVGEDEAFEKALITRKYAITLKETDAKLTYKIYPGIEKHSKPPDFDENLSRWLNEILGVEKLESE